MPFALRQSIAGHRHFWICGVRVNWGGEVRRGCFLFGTGRLMFSPMFKIRVFAIPVRINWSQRQTVGQPR